MRITACCAWLRCDLSQTTAPRTRWMCIMCGITRVGHSLSPLTPSTSLFAQSLCACNSTRYTPNIHHPLATHWPPTNHPLAAPLAPTFFGCDMLVVYSAVVVDGDGGASFWCIEHARRALQIRIGVVRIICNSGGALFILYTHHTRRALGRWDRKSNAAISTYTIYRAEAPAHMRTQRKARRRRQPNDRHIAQHVPRSSFVARGVCFIRILLYYMRRIIVRRAPYPHFILTAETQFIYSIVHPPRNGGDFHDFGWWTNTWTFAYTHTLYRTVMFACVCLRFGA